MSIFGWMFAAALANAVPINDGRSWLKDAEAPSPTRKRLEESPTWLFSLISPEGRIIRCDIVQSSGFPERDEKICAAITARAKFKPATDETGAPAYGTVKIGFDWYRPNQFSPGWLQTMTIPTDIEIQVRSLSDGAREKSVSIVTKADTSGHVTHCEGIRPKKNDAKLIDIACIQARAITMDVVKDNDGNPIPLMRSLLVAFRVPAQ